MRLRIALLLLTLSPAIACAGASKSQKSEPKALRDDRLNATLWQQTAAEFRANLVQAYSIARLRLDDALADRAAWPQVLTEGPSKLDGEPAVIVDVDETVLDNGPYEANEIRAGVHQHDEDRWAKLWVSRREAEAYPEALEFARYATSRGVHVFYVTNRSQLEDTTENLKKVGFPVEEGAVLVATNGSDKSDRRRLLASRYNVLLLIGDDLGDFLSYKVSDPGATKPRDMTVAERAAVVQQNASHFGRDWIIIPNGIYGSWERALYPGLKDPDAINLKKREALKGY